MPHCILEYSANVADRPNFDRLLGDLHEALMSTGQFSLADIRSRVIRHEHFRVGDGDPQRAFVALTVEILDGRGEEAKARVSEATHAVLMRHFPASLAQRTCAVTVQVRDIHRASYRRQTSNPK